MTTEQFPPDFKSLEAQRLQRVPDIQILLRRLFASLFDNELDDPQTVATLVQLIQNEYWMEYVQRIDSSVLLESLLKPLLADLEDALSRLETQLKLSPEYSQPLVTNRVVTDERQDLDQPCIITVDKNEYSKRVLYSPQTFGFYRNILANLKELQQSVIVRCNATRSADSLYKEVQSAFKKLEEAGLNDPVPEGYSFKQDPKKGFFTNELNKDDKDKWKKLRRFVPEFRIGNEDMGVSRDVWKKVAPFIQGSYWKVQTGFATWYALMVDGAPYEEQVLTILRKADFGRAHTKDAAAKIMGILSEHFKLFTDPEYKTVNPELLAVPYWVFSGADTIFGYTDPDEKESKNWKLEVLNSIIDWVGEFKPEHMAGVSLNYDFEIAMEHFLREFKPTHTPFNLRFSETIERTVNLPSDRLSAFRPSYPVAPIRRDHAYFARNDDDGIVILNDFFCWCKSFLKFSVDGSAQGLKIDVDKLYLVPKIGEEKNQTAEASDEEDRKPVSDAQTSTTFPITPPTMDVKVEVMTPEDSSDGKLTPVQKAINREAKKRTEEEYTRAKADKKKSLSKTLAFALGGKHLARMLFWCGGDSFVPELNIHLKIEKKKIRLVANSDVVAFNKQNFLYEWFIKALPNSTKELIYTVIHPRDKVRRVERFQHCFRNEKWLCPMDLKDFQIQFGPVHHRTIMRCFWRRTKSITDPQIRKEMEYICSTLHDELCRGVIFFRNNSTENWEEVKPLLTPERAKHIRQWKVQKPSEESFDPEDNEMEEDHMQEDPSQTLLEAEASQEPSKPQNAKSEKYRLFSAFEVKNGLLSGWKVTSAFGSIYNYSTNNLVNFWSLFYFGQVPTDYATQGDDTHFKTRFLIGSLFHTAFINSIGKVAHPKKQFFSTRYTEFLKKTYDVWRKDIRYQPCRIISSLLYENENRESKANNRNNLKDLVDLWNQFLVRLPDENRRKHISAVQRYPQKSIRAKFKWYSDKGGHHNYDLDRIDKLLSTPEFVNGFLSGPLTKSEYLCEKREEDPSRFKLFTEYWQAKMNDYIKEFEHGLNISKWSGIRSQVNNLSRKLSSNRKATFASEQAFRVELQNEMFKAIGESLTEYSKPPVLGELVKFPLSDQTNKYLELIELRREDIYHEIESNLVDYLRGKDLVTPFAQLLVMNSSFTKNIERTLRTRGGGALTNFEIFELLSGFSAKCRLTQNMFRKLIEHMDSKLLFDFAISSELGVSVTRQVVHDELLGAIALVVSETLPVLLTSLYNLRTLNLDEGSQREFVQTLILYLETDLYVRKHPQLVTLLRETAQKALLEAPF